jgi:hypothetical protein
VPSSKPKAADTVYEVYDDDGNVLATRTTPPVGVRFNVKTAGTRKAPTKEPFRGNAAGARVGLDDSHSASDSAG